MKQARKNDRYTLRVEGYGSDGAGVSHLPDGRAVFIKGALCGELCEIQLLKVGKKLAWAKVSRVLEASPERMESDCPYYPQCGGCQLRHITYEEELKFKRERVQQALRRIGGMSVTVSTMHPAKETNRYRNKIQFPVSGEPSKPNIGFYRARSHDVIDVEDCLLQPVQAGQLRRVVKDWMQTYGIEPYDEVRHKGLVRHVYVRVNHKGESLCVLVINGKRVPEKEALISALKSVDGLVGVSLSYHTERSNVILGKQTQSIWGEKRLRDTLCDMEFLLSPASFYQVNREQTHVLYQRAVELADLTGEETVLDLYCGIGTITLAMAQKAKRVIGAEIVPSAVTDAKENAKRNGVENVRFICADAKDVAKEMAQSGQTLDVVCVDPPRKGLASSVVDDIVQMQPHRIVYVSCDAGTLARDVKLFCEKGYEVLTVEACDMFPRTVHVEAIIMMTKCGLEDKK